MPDFELSWRQAAITACGLAGAGLALRGTRRPRLAAATTFATEGALILALFALWQYVGSFALLGPGGALARSRWIWHAERVAHLPSEASLQHVFLPHPPLVQALNLYYDSAHFPVMVACMAWLFVWHREHYRRTRTTVVVFTGICLLVQFVPVAPPRLLPAAGLVDTAVTYHQSVYATHGGFDPDQLSAMPSVHVGWALLVAVAVIAAVRTRWRWLALGYPAATTLAVVVTANHFWLDGIVAVLILALVLAGQHAARALLGRRAAKSALSSRSRTWQHCHNVNLVSTGGSNGHSPAGDGDDRAPAECDRPA